VRLKAVGNGCLQSNPECLYLPTAICKQKMLTNVPRLIPCVPPLPFVTTLLVLIAALASWDTRVKLAEMSTNVLLRLPRAARMLFAQTMSDPIHVPVKQDSLEMANPALVCTLFK